MRLLLVEDNAGDARLLREFLREAGVDDLELIDASRLGDALGVLQSEDVDVVLLDLSLPDSQGIETVRRTLPHAERTPIIVLTGLDDESVALQAVQAGAQDYLVKGHIDGRLLMRSIGYARERKWLELERIRALEREQEARAAAEAAVRARDEVMGIVSHDLGNSLTAIGMHCRVLERTAHRGVEEISRHTDSIRQLVDQMHRLRQDLIDVVSLEAGRLAIYLEEQPLEPIIREALDTFGELAAGKDLVLRGEVPEVLPDVRADRQRLLQVLSNLLGNAVKFTPERGEIALRVDPGAEEVCVSVLDSGPGIPPEHLERIFESFWRGRHGGRGGAGLGLAIAKGIITAHGGRIWAESEPGRGSALRFTLPLARQG